MTLARKGSRRLVFDEQEYRWTVSGDDGYIVLVVESETGHGQRLEAFFEYHNTVPDASGFPRMAGQLRVITPEVVRSVIRLGLDRGWRPLQTKLKPFRIQDADENIPVDRTKRAEPDASPNGGPKALFGKSSAGNGPPSVT
jgi:hypothetical protein